MSWAIKLSKLSCVLATFDKEQRLNVNDFKQHLSYL